MWGGGTRQIELPGESQWFISKWRMILPVDIHHSLFLNQLHGMCLRLKLYNFTFITTAKTCDKMTLKVHGSYHFIAGSFNVNDKMVQKHIPPPLFWIQMYNYNNNKVKAVKKIYITKNTLHSGNNRSYSISISLRLFLWWPNIDSRHHPEFTGWCLQVSIGIKEL